MHACTAWCSEIGSLTSLDACNSGAYSDESENQFHCTRLYTCSCMNISFEKAVTGLCTSCNKNRKMSKGHM